MVKQLITCLETETLQNISTIPDEDWSILIYLITKKAANKDVLNDGNNLSQCYKNIDYLKYLNPREFVKERNKIVVSFLEGISGLNFESDLSDGKFYGIACAIESIYLLRNFNWVLPNSFILNLIQSFISGSKSVTAVNGKVYPSGSYTTYNEWLKLQGSNNLVCPPVDRRTVLQAL